MCLVLILNLHLLLSSHLCLTSLCEHFFQLYHCRSEFIFKEKYTMVQNISHTSVTCQHSCLTIPYLFFHFQSWCIFKCTKIKFGDKDRSKTNISHQTVTFTFFLINSRLLCILISLFLYTVVPYFLSLTEKHIVPNMVLLLTAILNQYVVVCSFVSFCFPLCLCTSLFLIPQGVLHCV